MKLELQTEGDDPNVGELDSMKEGAEPLAPDPKPDAVPNPQSVDGAVVKGHAVDSPKPEEPKDDVLGGNVLEGVEEEKGFTDNPKGDGEDCAAKTDEANGVVVDAPKAAEAKDGVWEAANELVEVEEEKGFADGWPKGRGPNGVEDAKSAELNTGVWQPNKLAEVEEKGVANDWPN